MARRDELAEAIDAYARERKQRFEFGALLGHLRRRRIEGGRFDEDEAYAVLASSEYVFEEENHAVFGARFRPRRLFFAGARFRVLPSALEIEEGALIPGHRFYPFVSREIFPSDVRLTLPDGTEAATRRLRLPAGEAFRRLRFFGSFRSMEYLVFDDPENAERFRAVEGDNADFSVSTFDLRDFFARSGFRHGDWLELTVADWLEGIVSIERVPEGRGIDPSAVSEWRETLDANLEAIVDEFGPEIDCCEQLAQTIYLASIDPDGVSLTEGPPMGFEDFFDAQEFYAVREVADRALFWPANEDPRRARLDRSAEHPFDPESELDGFFGELGLSLREAEAEAYMRDALFRGVETPETVLERIASGCALLFSSAEKQERFHELWREKWEVVRSGYSRAADEPYAALRARVLSTNDRMLAALREMDRGKMSVEQVLENPATMKLGEMSTMISEALESLNDDSAPEGLEEMAAAMDSLDRATTALIRVLLESGGGAQAGLPPGEAT